MLEIAEAGAAHPLRHRDAVQAERAHFRPEMARKPVFAVDLFGQRRDLVLRKPRNGLADRIRRFAKIKIERFCSIGDHVSTPVSVSY